MPTERDRPRGWRGKQAGAPRDDRPPLLRHSGPEAVFARREDRPISVAEFLSEVTALGRALPPRRHVVNLCRDRYRFCIGFAAALCRGQITLLPPSELPALLTQLAIDYPDLYCLTDGVAPKGVLPVFDYQAPLAAAGAGSAEVPRFAVGAPAVVLFTSGSTGRPQPHARSWGALIRSTFAAGCRLGTAQFGEASLLGTVPHQHSYGLESLIMLALQHGLALQAERLFYPADICARLAMAPRPRLFVTTPIHLKILLAEAGDLPPADFLLSATAPLSPQLAREAERRFAAPLHEIYGCSEAGQIAARRTISGATWRCLNGITLRQEGDDTFARGGPIEVETRLSDLIELRDSEHFLLHGRIADVVNIAGKRTSLAHLNYHLNAIDGVRDGVFVMSDRPEDDCGVTRLVAFAVAPALGTEAILAALRRQIDPAFLPRPLFLVDALPRNALGKLPQEAIERLMAQARASEG